MEKYARLDAVLIKKAPQRAPHCPTPDMRAVLKTNTTMRREKIRDKILDTQRGGSPKLLKRAIRTTQEKLEKPSTFSPGLKISPFP
jgi:hypothetical protein